jgi:HEAT repeat protein
MRYIDQRIEPEAALRDLGSENPAVRAAAAAALGQIGRGLEERVCPALRARLADDRSEVRYAAALSLGELGDRTALDTLVAQLEGDGNPLAREAAAIALGLLGDPLAAEPLLHALVDGPPEVRFQAATSIVEVARARARAPLERALGDSDPEVRSAAAEALGDLGEGEAGTALARLLDDGAAGVRFEAALALARLGDPRGVPVLAGLLDDRELAPAAAEHLFLCPGREAIPALLGLLDRWLAPAVAKVWAAGALARLGREEGRRRLLHLLSSRSAMIRGLAVQVLGELGEQEWARRSLEELAASPRGAALSEEIAAALAPKEPRP